MPHTHGHRQKGSIKPLATKATRGLLPILFVDTRTSKCGPMAPRESMVPDLAHPTGETCVIRVKDPYVYNPDQAALAAAQWSSSSSEPEDAPWIKSWYFPSDAFAQWPDKPTGLRCWHCTYKFDWPPFPLPKSYNKTTGKYRVLAGGFCGPSCAKAYAKTASCICNSADVLFMIDQIAYAHFGYKTPTGLMPHIPVAPRKELLKKYCGPKGLSIQQYRSICAHGRRLKLLDPGYITMKQVIEAEDATARQRDANGVGRVYHAEDPDNIRSVQETVKMQRSVFRGKGVRSITQFYKQTE